MKPAKSTIGYQPEKHHATFDLIFNEVRFQIRSSLSNWRLFSRFNALDLSIDPIARFQICVPLIGDEFSYVVLSRHLDFLDLSINCTCSSALLFNLAFPVNVSELHVPLRCQNQLPNYRAQRKLGPVSIGNPRSRRRKLWKLIHSVLHSRSPRPNGNEKPRRHLRILLKPLFLCLQHA
jgi:hypothetical protein